jgi:hypothetical protein
MVDAQKTAERQDLHLREIHELARRLDAGALEECMRHQMEQGSNICAEKGSYEIGANLNMEFRTL